MPEGAGLLAYLEKGEIGILRGLGASEKTSYDLRVENGALIIPQERERYEEDCYGNTFPACGGCLWAQGVIQCP
jgi:hypothetical protein